MKRNANVFFHLKWALDAAVAALVKKDGGVDEFLEEIKRFFQSDILTKEDEKELGQCWEQYLANMEKTKPKATPAAVALRLFNQRCGVTWAKGGHSDTPIQTTATGTGADAFAGNYDNTDICRRLEALLPAVPAAAAGTKKD